MSDEAARCELAILGAGVVGCALAGALGRRFGSVLVLEGAAREGTGVSSRNSGVVHAGLYYPPGSRKARSCVAGNAMLWSWAQFHGVGHRRTGKLVVATDPEQEAALEQLIANAAASGAALERISLAQARALEPSLPATIRAALWSPSSGIVDAHELVRSLLVDAEHAGVEFVFSAPVEGIEALAGGFGLTTPRGTVIAERVVNAAGLGAVPIANLLGLSRRLFLARGDYFRLRTSTRWRRLIYPVAVPGSASLGIHLTLELDGRCRLGPDLEWVEEPDDFSPERGEAKHGKFLAAAQRLLGPIAAEDLSYDGCGIRPKLVGPGEPAADFEIVEHPRGCWHLLGIESPGLTASLALAQEVSGLLE
ncbi:MAG: NAD(P)/FAD-dependent oxidoreductase [Enhygromyxa sp.]